MSDTNYRRAGRPPAGVFLVWLLAWPFFFAHPLSAAEVSASEQILDQWLQHQATIQTWSADVLQIRHLKALSRPLETRGRVWFQYPNRFRWQLGHPPRTIAVRTHESLLIVYPRLKRVEKFPLTGELEPGWQYVMALLDIGFPSDPETFYASYDLTGAEKKENTWRFDLRPASGEARRLLDSVRLEISALDLTLQATELAFPDGSIMRNEFLNLQLNPDLKSGLFDLEIPEDYEVVHPLAGGR